MSNTIFGPAKIPPFAVSKQQIYSLRFALHFGEMDPFSERLRGSIVKTPKAQLSLYHRRELWLAAEARFHPAHRYSTVV